MVKQDRELVSIGLKACLGSFVLFLAHSMAEERRWRENGHEGGRTFNEEPTVSVFVQAQRHLCILCSYVATFCGREMMCMH